MAVTTSNLTPTPRAWKQFTNRPEDGAACAAIPHCVTTRPEVASTKKLRQMGLWAYARYCRNMGIDFIDCYVTIFGRMPKDKYCSKSESVAAVAKERGFRLFDLKLASEDDVGCKGLPS